MAYVIPENKPFIIKGKKGEYLIPAFNSLSFDQIAGVMALTPETPAPERVAAVKEFLLKMQPALADEGLGDVGYANIFAAYEKEQKVGK